MTMTVPLDALRGGLLRVIARLPFVRAWVVRRDARIIARAVTAIVFAFSLTMVAPALSLGLGPILFGVPHAASSVRYLALRRALTRVEIGALLTISALVVTLRGLEAKALTPSAVFARAEVGVGLVAATLVIVHAGAETRRWARAGLALFALGVAAAFAARDPRAARLAFVHVHNLGVVVLWLLLFRRGERRLGGLVIASVLIGALAIIVGGATLGLGPSESVALGVDIREVAAWLAPTASAGVGLALVLAHAFTDSVHYAFWLGVVPEETLRGEGSPTFRMTARSLLRDFGQVGFALLATLALIILALAIASPSIARRTYFVVAGFHGHIEALALVDVLVRGGAARRALLPGPR